MAVLPSEKLRIGVLAVVVLLVYTAAFAFVILSIRRILGRRRAEAVPALRRWLWWTRTTAFALAAIGICCAAYAKFVEPYWLEVTHVRIKIRKLTAGSRPVRFVQISDVHSEREARLEGRLPVVIATEHPDFIVFTGDAVNSPEGLGNFRTLMSRLAKIAPTYAVRGNWDVWYWNKLDLFGGTGVIELAASAVRVPVPGTDVWVGGVPVGSEAQIPTVLAGIPATAISVLIYHYPDEIEDIRGLGLDLYCAGHTHGGQVAVPGYGALVTFSKFGKRYEAGLYHEGSTAMYVNRGIGMEGGAAPRVRFFARPEVTVIELAPQ